MADKPDTYVWVKLKDTPNSSSYGGGATVVGVYTSEEAAHNSTVYRTENEHIKIVKVKLED